MRALFLLIGLLPVLIQHPGIAEWIITQSQPANPAYQATITSPVTGQAVQGSVVIRGTMDTSGFQSYELDFTYNDDPTPSWFLIEESTSPIQEGILAIWDTTTITDGDYTLRLLVTLNDGAQVEMAVNHLRVRNYTPIETDTPAPTPMYVTLAPSSLPVFASPVETLAPTQLLYPNTPTPLPTNPAVVTSRQMTQALVEGAATSVGLLTLLGVYLGLRSILKKNR